MTDPYLADKDLTLYNGDALTVLRQLPDASVHMICTSPPFYGLRDYGADGQIGLEDLSDQYIAKLVEVFREARRVLRYDGTLWVEIGDTYASAAMGEFKPKDLMMIPFRLALALRADGWWLRRDIIWEKPDAMPESATDRCSTSHSYVFHFAKEPYYFYDTDAIRRPFETDRMPGQKINETHHYGARTGGNTGLTDHIAVVKARLLAERRPQVETLDGSEGEAPRGPDGRRKTTTKGMENSEQHRDGERWPNELGANERSVWRIPTGTNKFKHFAVWPEKLVSKMIAVGTSERGVCPECGNPWVRETERVDEGWDGSKYGERAVARSEGAQTGTFAKSTLGSSGGKLTGKSKTLGWIPGCGHGHAPVPAVVLDPFGGSGTTAKVARYHGRHCILIELNPDYCKLAADRLSQQSLLTFTEVYE